MKLSTISPKNTAAGTIDMPKQFDERIRPDLIKRAVLAIQANRRQAYGAYEEAGKRASVRISKRRHAYRGTYGIGQSRTPRKVMSYRGTRFNWTGAFAPQTVGGRRAHPPKAEKSWKQKINDKERRKAIRSALAATLDKDIVAARGHLAPADYPFIITDEFQELEKTKDVKTALASIGMAADLARAEPKKVRAGKGKMRGRKHKQATSILIVTSKECKLTKAAQSIPGIDITTIEELNAELLAPGTAPGRMTLYTESAIKTLASKKLYTEQSVKPKEEKETTPPKKQAAKPEEEKPQKEEAKKQAPKPKQEKKPEVSA